MNPALRHQLNQIDRTLLALLDERLRLLAEDEAASAGSVARAPAIEDLLRRHCGPFPAAGVREVFAAIESACASASARTKDREGDRGDRSPP